MPKVIFKIEAPVLVQQVGAQKTQPHRQATQEPCQELTATGLTFRPNRGSYRESSQYSNGWTGATPMGWDLGNLVLLTEALSNPAEVSADIPHQTNELVLRQLGLAWWLTHQRLGARTG